MFTLFKEIKNHIDVKGVMISENHELEHSFRTAESICQSLLGATLQVRGRKFILRMLEIYYGGAGDISHDWYRTHFVYKKSKYVEHTNVQLMKGFRIYLSSNNIEDSYTRFDIVVGEENIAISFLVRSVYDENNKIIGTKKGSPNIILKEIGLGRSDHGREISINENQESEISLHNISEKKMKPNNLIIKRNKRVNLKSDFEEKYNLKWNFCVDIKK